MIQPVIALSLSTSAEAAALFARRFGTDADGRPRIVEGLAGNWDKQGFAGTFRLAGGTRTYLLRGDNGGNWNVYLAERP